MKKIYTQKKLITAHYSTKKMEVNKTHKFIGKKNKKRERERIKKTHKIYYIYPYVFKKKI